MIIKNPSNSKESEESWLVNYCTRKNFRCWLILDFWGSGLREALTRKLPGVWGTVPTSIYSQWIAHLSLCSHIGILLILHSTFNMRAIFFDTVCWCSQSWVGLAIQVFYLHTLVLQSGLPFFDRDKYHWLQLRSLGSIDMGGTCPSVCKCLLMTSCIRTLPLDHTRADWSLNHVVTPTWCPAC